MTIKNEFDKTPDSVLEKEVQGQKPKILMVDANGHFKELTYEVAHDGNFLVHPSNFAQEQKPLFKVLIDKHPGLADKLASLSANTNHVVSQKPAETTDKLVRSCATCKYQPQTLHSALPKCIHCKAFNNWEPKP